MLAKSTVRWKNLSVHCTHFILCPFEECCFLFLFHDYDFLLLYPQGWSSSILPPCEIKGAFLKSQKFLQKTFFVWNPKFLQKLGIIFRWELDPPPSQIWARPPTLTSGDTRQRHFPLQHSISQRQIYLNFGNMRVLFLLDNILLPSSPFLKFCPNSHQRTSPMYTGDHAERAGHCSRLFLVLLFTHCCISSN